MKLEDTSPERRRRSLRFLRGLAIDITPLRQSRDFRLLWTGQLISMTGRQITAVALPLQVYLLTRSPFDVGLIGLAQLLPMVLFSPFGGTIADRVDRRVLILTTEVGLAASGGLLVLGALGHPPIVYLYTVAALQWAIIALNSPARSAAVANVVEPGQLPAAFALSHTLLNGTMILGPALGGLIIAKLGAHGTYSGLRWAYAVDLVSYAATIAAAFLMRPLPPKREPQDAPATIWRSIREGFAYLKGKRILLSTFAIDFEAMVFGMPRALFPVLALTVFHTGPAGVGLLYAAPAAGAVIGGLTTGWVGRVRRQGLAVIWAVIVWGAAIAVFGLTRNLAVALVLLAVAGAGDMISGVFRGTIMQVSVPDSIRGRISAASLVVVAGGPSLGDVEAGAVASLVSPTFSVVTGGMACVLGAAVLALLVPEFARYKVETP